MPDRRTNIEWPTVAAVAACYAIWLAGVTILSTYWLPLGIVIVALSAAFHSSLQHEVIHHHPFRNELINQILVTPALSLFIPYQRFRDTHRAHHDDETLTDPYDDPESNYMDPSVWIALPGLVQAILRANNTLLGRIIIGPAIGQAAFVTADMKAIRAGDRSVRDAWMWHIPAVGGVVCVIYFAAMPFWAYFIGAYCALSILKVRTFLEHRADPDPAARTVIVEDRGLLAFLFLNNNLHVVHHAHPGVPWYALPALFRERRSAFLARNGGYRYSSYSEVFARHFLMAKDPLPHPLMPTPLDAPEAKSAFTETQGEGRHAHASDFRNRGLHAH